jgi:hypothetical protein
VIATWIAETVTYALDTTAKTIKGAINELVATVGNKLAKTTNITAIDDTGIADGEIIVANLTAKKLETSNVLIGDLAQKKPIAKYTHTTNLEIMVSAIDTTTNVFTSNSHGLQNGNNINFIVINNAKTIYPINIFPGGVTAPYNGYFIIGVTQNTFQISVDGVNAFDVTPNASMDLTKFKIVKAVTEIITISGLPPKKRYRVVISGQSYNPGDGIKITPNTTMSGLNFLNQASNTFNDYPQAFLGDIATFADIIIDYSNFLTIMASAIRARPSTTTNNSTGNSVLYSIAPFYTNTDITSIVLQSARFVNGTTVEVYDV